MDNTTSSCSIVVDARVVAAGAAKGYEEERLAEAYRITQASLLNHVDHNSSKTSGGTAEQQQFKEGITSNYPNLPQSYKKGNIGISFNGGKDSVVAMELLIEMAGLETVKKMCIFMFEEENEFEQLVHYRNEYLKKRGDLPLEIVPKSMDWAAGLKMLQEKYNMEGVIIGTRSTDPDGVYQKVPVAATTGKFPPMIRYCPVFNWTLDDVWYFLASKRIPICSLYELGYTSLGSKSTTRPNPHLLLMNSEAVRQQEGGGGPVMARAGSSSGGAGMENREQSSSGNFEMDSPARSQMYWQQSSAGGGSGGSSSSAVVVGVSTLPEGSLLAYKPAWELHDDQYERAGRGKIPKV